METIHAPDEEQQQPIESRIESMISAHPLPAVGAAFALGALVAFASGRIGKRGERSIGGMIVAGLGAVAVRLAKSYAFARLGDAAKSWFAENSRSTPSETERAASREPATESFLRH